MISKCAEALALRRAFPDALSGVYTDDEMLQAEDKPDQNDSLTKKQVLEFVSKLDKIPEYKKSIIKFLEKNNITNPFDIPKEMYEQIMKQANQEINQASKDVIEYINAEEINKIKEMIAQLSVEKYNELLKILNVKDFSKVAKEKYEKAVKFIGNYVKKYLENKEK